MVVVFLNEELQRVDAERDFDGSFDAEVADEIRHRLQILRAATAEFSLLSLRSLDAQSLGDGHYLLRITDEHWLEVEIKHAAQIRAVVLAVTSRVNATHTA